jgi:hypothetical protein
VHASRAVSVKLREDAHLSVDKPKPAGRPGDRGELVSNTEASHNPVDLIVQMDGARLRKYALPPIGTRHSIP